MKTERVLQLTYSSSLSDLCEVNSSFDSGRLRVAYTDKNRNGSFISKESFERSIATIFNCPIVCRYDRDTDTIGSHDMELVKDGGGDLRLVNLTHPVGVVPQSAKYWWEIAADENGVEHEYLCVDVLLWKRQEAYKKIKEDGITDESMEITVKEGRMVDGVYVIDRFEFTAFCLLGAAEPCYEGASLETFSIDGVQSQLSQMMREFKETFALAQSPEGVCEETRSDLEGGEKALDEKKALAAKYGFDIEKLGFSVEDLTLEELQARFEEMKTAGKSTGDSGKDPGGGQDFALESQFVEELIGSLRAEKTETAWGADDRYWFYDYDKALSEVYAYDVTDWNLYAFAFSMDGDRVVIDFAGKKRMKLALVPFDEGSGDDPVSGMFAKIAGHYAESEKQWSEKFEAESNRAASMESELSDLRKFKNDAEDAAAKEALEAVFEKFTNLEGVEAFEKLRQNSDGVCVEDLEEKCYAILGRTGASAKFSLGDSAKAPKLPVEKTGVRPEPYGGVFTEYGITTVDQSTK